MKHEISCGFWGQLIVQTKIHVDFVDLLPMEGVVTEPMEGVVTCFQLIIHATT